MSEDMFPLCELPSFRKESYLSCKEDSKKLTQITNTFQNENDMWLHIFLFFSKGKLVGTEKIGKTRNFMPNTVFHRPRNLREIVSSTEKMELILSVLAIL